MLTTLDIITTFGFRFLLLALMALGSAGCLFLAQWLKAKAAESKNDVLSRMSWDQKQTFNDIIEKAVQAAEQVFKGEGKGGEKLIYVKGLALQAADQLGYEFTDGQMNAFIESAVYVLKQAAKQIE